MIEILISFETQEQVDAFVANLPEGATLAEVEVDETDAELVELLEADPEPVTEAEVVV